VVSRPRRTLRGLIKLNEINETRKVAMGSSLDFPNELWIQISRLATADITSSLERFHLGANRSARNWRETKAYTDSLVAEFNPFALYHS
jgi:hypothetical protein